MQGEKGLLELVSLQDYGNAILSDKIWGYNVKN